MSKSALVISGGGSKGAFAGGIAQYLIEETKQHYDLFLGTSTGSLLISHLALNKIKEIKKAFTSVSQSDVFDNSPFLIRKKGALTRIKINHFNVLKNFIRGKKTFGESNNLRNLLVREIPITYFNELKSKKTDVVVCVSNLSSNTVEYKTLQECSYEDFIDWIWISCNYVPFMSLITKNGCEYADGGLGCIIAIEEAIRQGATQIDAIILNTKFQQTNRVHSRNAFDALSSVFGFISDRIEHQNLKIGNLVALDENVKLRIFYTPRILTTNSLVFDKEKMNSWWQEGWEHAEKIIIASK
jgi:predicted patatin/cPLA2 family phospholipase